MSVICDALILISREPEGTIDAVNLALEDDSRGQGFKPLDTAGAGGSKVFCASVWAAAFNHLPPERIERAVASVEWRDPDRTVLVLDPYDYDMTVSCRTITQIRKEIASP
jgi:hypothetical protein